MRTARTLLLVVAAVLLIATVAAAGPERQTFRVPMSDGAKLDTDVFLPFQDWSCGDEAPLGGVAGPITATGSRLCVQPIPELDD